MKKMTIQQVYEYINTDESNNDFAIRGDNHIPVKKFRNSWYQGDETEMFKLPGVSAIFLPTYSLEHLTKACDRAIKYGCHIFLLKGEMQNAHPIYNDPNEIIMTEHKIICEIVP